MKLDKLRPLCLIEIQESCSHRQVRLRMENLIQRLTDNGDVIVQFFCAIAAGQPFMTRVVKELPLTKEQEAVAQGIATPERKKIARKQRRFIVYRRPYYRSMPRDRGSLRVARGPGVW